MKIITTPIKDLYVIQHNIFTDERGVFIKTYNDSVFKSLGLEFNDKERYYSISKKNVIRGMHFQNPPADHIKIVTVISGKILDVILDIRKNSLTYGKCYSIELRAELGQSLYIPKGFAHGFKSLVDGTIVEYNQTSEYSPENDSGIRYDSFGFKWESINTILSNRDLSFPNFFDFNTPFI
ncbi:MAG: dTDP-4-dehydrorhamnose 3,5-epimerase family protein [Bacteroidales bacterium]